MFYYGYLAAKAGIRVIDVNQIDGNVRKVMDRCASAPNITVPQAFRQALGRRGCPIASEFFCGSMAYAIIGDLFVTTLLTPFFPPALYVAWFCIKEPRKEPEPSLGAGVPAAAK